MEQFKVNFIQDFVKLLDLLARVNDANEDSPFNSVSDRERLGDAHWLVNKSLSHALVILHLLDDTNIESLPSFPKFKLFHVVSASIYVLTRATFESFLVFHYVFFAPTTTEEKNFRYWARKAAGIIERQKYPINNEEFRQKLENGKTELHELLGKLESNKVFQNLSPKQRARFLEGKEPNWWRWNPDRKNFLGLDDIAIDAGFSNVLASDMYSYLCGYAHSNDLSVFQLRQIFMDKGKETSTVVNLSISILSIVIANLILEYSELFPLAQDVLSKDPEGNKLLKQYVEIGHSLDKYRGMSQKNA